MWHDSPSPLDRSVDRAIAQENADPQGLPANIIAGMEADIRANRERYPEINRILDEIEASR